MCAFTRSIILLLSFAYHFATVHNNMMNLSIQDPNHFGPFNLNYTRLNLCMGPKSKNLTKFSLDLSSEGFKFYGHLNLTFFAATTFDEGKLMVYSIKDGKINSVLWTHKINNICKHFAFATLIQTYLRAPNCIVTKGTYTLVLNFEEIQNKFFGTSFFYGEFLLKVTFFSKKGNIVCFYVGLLFTKKSLSS